ncbi:hypothetical protein R5R35_003988 [Gryllus longicercus]|uniref:Uncharacterized protein n=1 Tax=Gryllus longicercus TaxID=2509291 RepID=A0AAN9Z7R3_9ORTH
METTFKGVLNTMEKTIEEKVEKSIKRFEERFKKLESSVQSIKDKARQREEEESRRMEEIIQKRLETTIKTLEERLQKKLEEEILNVQERTHKNMLEALRVVEGGRKQLIKDEVHAMEERSVEKIEQTVRAMEVSMPEKVEQRIRENDDRMKRLEYMVRGRERRVHELLQKIEENSAKCERKSSNSSEHSSSKPTTDGREDADKIEDRMANLEAFVNTSVSSMFTRVEVLISQIEGHPNQGSSHQTSPASTTKPGTDEERNLRMAAKEGDVAAVRSALSAGVPVDCQCPSGLTALHWGAREGHAVVVKLLLDAGADPDRADNHGRTALHSAAEGSRVECVEALVAEGADVEKQDEYGWTALHVAANSGHAPVVRALLRAGADRARRSRVGETPLDVTFRVAIRHLLRQRPDVDDGSHAPTADGAATLTPTHRATMRQLRLALRDDDGTPAAANRPRDKSLGRSPRGGHFHFKATPYRGRKFNPNVPGQFRGRGGSSGRGRGFSSSTESIRDDGFVYKNKYEDDTYF